jgi:hypothetical protein
MIFVYSTGIHQWGTTLTTSDNIAFGKMAAGESSVSSSGSLMNFSSGFTNHR